MPSPVATGLPSGPVSLTPVNLILTPSGEGQVEFSRRDGDGAGAGRDRRLQVGVGEGRGGKRQGQNDRQPGGADGVGHASPPNGDGARVGAEYDSGCSRQAV